MVEEVIHEGNIIKFSFFVKCLAKVPRHYGKDPWKYPLAFQYSGLTARKVGWSGLPCFSIMNLEGIYRLNQLIYYSIKYKLICNHLSQNPRKINSSSGF